MGHAISALILALCLTTFFFDRTSRLLLRRQPNRKYKLPVGHEHRLFLFNTFNQSKSISNSIWGFEIQF